MRKEEKERKGKITDLDPLGAEDVYFVPYSLNGALPLDYNVQLRISPSL